jgi:hypothetical protein
MPRDTDQRVALTRQLLATNRDCAAHKSLQWFVALRPHGIYWADGEFADRRYASAFRAYQSIVAISRIDDPRHPAALDKVLSFAADGDYRAALAAVHDIPPPIDDLTELIVGAVDLVSGRRAEAKATWINGVGRGSVPGGSPLYGGPSLSLLFLLDRTILAVECGGRQPAPRPTVRSPHRP